MNEYKNITLKGYFKEVADKTARVIDRLEEDKSV